MKCKNEKCDIDHNGTFGSGKYCSRGCANSRSHSSETKQKISDSVKSHINNAGKTSSSKNMTLDEFNLMVERRAKTWNDKFLNQEFETLNVHSIKRRILLEQNNKCNRCGLLEWRGQQIPLELEHKNGNHSDNSRDNLECLCPNCHSLTPTWRGRNKNSNRNKVTDNDICRTFLQSNNIRQTLIKLGLAPKGGNYGRVKRCLTMAGIKYK